MWLDNRVASESFARRVATLPVASAPVSGTPAAPPPHVLAAFGARLVKPELLDRGPCWVSGAIVFRPITSTTEAAWTARVLDTLRLADVRVSRPLRSTDGRWVVSGWSACKLVEGRPEPRHDEVVTVSLKLSSGTADLGRPRFLDARRDVYAVADRAAWGEHEVSLDPDRGGRLFGVLAGSLRPTALRPQVVHGDLFGNVLFRTGHPPGVMDFVAYWRPAEWAAAVVVVDALAWGGADPGIVRRWSHLADWPQALLRALLYRIAVTAMHPQTTRESLAGIERAARHVIDVL